MTEERASQFTVRTPAPAAASWTSALASLLASRLPRSSPRRQFPSSPTLVHSPSTPHQVCAVCSRAWGVSAGAQLPCNPRRRPTADQAAAAAAFPLRSLAASLSSPLSSLLQDLTGAALRHPLAAKHEYTASQHGAGTRSGGVRSVGSSRRALQPRFRHSVRAGECVSVLGAVLLLRLQ